MNLSQQDQALLEQLESKLTRVRDRVTSVVRRYTHGFLLYGEGGTCKSYTVVQELERLQADYKLFNSRMSGRGLFDALCRHPDSVHFLEDMERIFRDTMAQGVLRSALWGQVRDGVEERVVTWNAHATNHRFRFTGGIIITSNRPLHDVPELRALGTRLNPLHLHCTNEEIAALMRKVAMQGHRHFDTTLAPEDCLEVAEFVIDQSRRMNRNLDMRALIIGFKDRLQFNDGQAASDWQDLVLARLAEQAVPAKESRQDRKLREQEIAREIKDLPRDERLRVWTERTGKSEAALYRRLNEIE